MLHLLSVGSQSFVPLVKTLHYDIRGGRGRGRGRCRGLLEGGERWLSRGKHSLGLHSAAAAAAGGRRCIQMDAPTRPQRLHVTMVPTGEGARWRVPSPGGLLQAAAARPFHLRCCDFRLNSGGGRARVHTRVFLFSQWSVTITAAIFE